ncbi:MAG: cation:proton antiporter [Candidatus Omnitrophica bacterium]|nr:cation:proton antiporter [Candidatus Omnitrophota bacterium]
MPTHAFLPDFLLVLIMATGVAFAFERMRLPATLGYLLAGMIIGPHGFGWLSHLQSIRQMAEVGVIFLMLTIGLEFSFDRLKGMRKVAMIGGSLQILISISIGILFARWQGWSNYLGFFIGSTAAMSSSALVLKHLIDRGEIDTQHGRIAVSILIFQDLTVAPLMIFAKSLGQPADLLMSTLGTALINATVLIAVVGIFARFVLPFSLHRIAVSRSREIFFLSVAAISSATIWFSNALGLSPAIGAFLAGFMFANTDFRNQLVGEIVPFRHLFVSIFFVSLGLLFDFSFVSAHAGSVAAFVGLILFLNFVLMSVTILLFRFTLRIALATGLILSQIGEFSFLLFESAREVRAIDDFLYQLLLSVAFITMIATPFLFMLLPLVLGVAERVPLFGTPPTHWRKTVRSAGRQKNHIILCGFGPTGRDLAFSLKRENLPFLIIEMNPSYINEARKHGIEALYGDAANQEVMLRAGIAEARAAVITFGDSVGMEQIVRVVGRLNSQAMLIARTRFEADVARLYELGADVVVTEELEASIELTRLALAQLKIPEENIRVHLERIRGRKELAIEEAILHKNARGKT